MHYVDHHSGFAHVALLKSKALQEVGKELVRILGGAAQPQVPQSDNGTEFLGRCIPIVRKHYNTI
jgi:hypothetical protein